MKKHWMAMTLTAALCLSAVSVGSIPAAAQAEPTTYPTTYDEYTALRETCPELYRFDGDSVYFINPDISSTEMSLIVSSNNEVTVTHNTYGTVFKPEEEGIYVVSVVTNREEIAIIPSDPPGYSHRFCSEINDYVITAAFGDIHSVEYVGSRSQTSKKEPELLSGEYFSLVNGFLPDGDSHYDSYITTVYSPYSVESYFCVNVFYSEIIPYMPRVLSSDESIARVDMELYTSSSSASDDIQNFFSVKALQDGDVTVTADGQYWYDLTVKDGIFHHVRENTETVLPGDLDSDGSFGVRDVVLFQRWLCTASEVSITNRNAADFNQDGVLDIFDLALMKRALLKIS